MKTTRLLKSILIPALGISAIGTIATVSTSCGCGSKNPDIVHVSSVSLDKTSIILAVGDTKTLTATVLPEKATDKSVVWSSSHPNIATVNQNGTITAVGLGNATITVRTNDGDKTATCEVKVNDLNECIGVIANKRSTLTLSNQGANNPDLQYSIDNGASWSQYSSYLSINEGQTLYLKGNNPNGWSHSASVYSYLSITGDVSIFGNVMGLLDNEAMLGEQGDITDIPSAYCFYGLFRNSNGITSVSDDFLPATTLTNYCYAYMFQGCTSLTTAPELPATTLTEVCYAYMFQGCTSLKSAPKLPATSLANYCYIYIFSGCESLTTAPELPATTLADYCYTYMFFNCTLLNSIKIGYTGNYSGVHFNNWVSGVARSGTFYYNGSQTAQDFQLPSGWTKNEDSYVTIIANKYSTLTLNNQGDNNPDLQYSTDGTSWSQYSSYLSINEGQTLYLKGNNPNGWSHSVSVYSYLSITGDVSISGNIMGLLDNEAKTGEQGNITDIPCDFCFYDLFKNSTGITSVSGNLLPATSLTDRCYTYMFEGCTSLTTVPELPATSLANDCYAYMFSGCSKLTTAPMLPATTLVDSCYYYMFFNCTHLNSIKIGYTGNYSGVYFNNWVSGVADSGTFYYNGSQTAQDFRLPSGWTKNGDSYVTIIANKHSTLTLNNLGNSNPDLQYSTDGTSWSQYSSYLSINEGQTLYLKGNNPNGWSHSASVYSYLSITGDVSIFGNVMGLLDNGAKTGEQGNITNIPCDFCFYDLFKNSTGITSVSGDFLPATILSISCYNGMFYQCSSLITAPELPATTLANYCYYYMFLNCTSLESAPKLPATSLANYCYAYMFSGCRSLTTAPELPATTLTDRCYESMFEGCTHLNSIKIGYKGNYSDVYFNRWVYYVPDSGTFYYNGSQTPQDFKLPEGWKSQPF